MAKITVLAHVDRQNKSVEVDLNAGSCVKDLLLQLKINPVTVIVSRDDELILEDETLKNNDEIKVLSVISGG